MLETVLKMSLYGCMAAAGVLLLRLTPRLRPNVKFLLWGIVFLRLILPPSLLTIPSAISLQAVVPEQAVLATLPSRIAQAPDAMPSMPTGGKAAPDTNPSTPSQGETAFEWLGLLEGIWLSGMAICLLLMFFFYVRARKQPKHETAIKGVYVSDYFRSPIVIGIRRPCILFPASMNPETAANILLHERTHIRRGDHITKPLFLAIAAIHWFNPFAWLAYCLAVRDMEMAVDEAVLRATPQDNRKQYASELLLAAQSTSFAFPGFGESNIKSRIKRILNFRKPSRWIGAASLLLVIATVMFLLAGGRPVGTEPLYAYKSEYVGDNSNTVNLLISLPYGTALKKTELRTDAPPYGIVATYDFTVFSSIPEDYEGVWKDIAATVFVLIGNVDEIYFNSGANTYYIAYRTDFDMEFGQDMRLFAKDENTFSAFLKMLEVESQSSPVPSPVVQPTLAPSEQPEPPAFIMLGADDPLTDFTMDLPSDCTLKVGMYNAGYQRNGFYAGYIGLVSYYSNMSYDQLTNNHTERLGEWKEEKINFKNGGAWAEGLEKILIGRFQSDDYDDPRSGRLYDHTTYILIFKEVKTFINYAGDELTYQDCYQLDFTTTYYDENGTPTQVFSDEEILAMVQSFALKGNKIYMPAKSFDEMYDIAGELLIQALHENATPEARTMYEAMGKPDPIRKEDILWSSWVKAEDGIRVFYWAFDKGGVRAQVRINMDTGELLGLTWMTP